MFDTAHTCHLGPYCAPHYDEAITTSTLGFLCDHDSCTEMDNESCAGCFADAMSEYEAQAARELVAP